MTDSPYTDPPYTEGWPMDVHELELIGIWPEDRDKPPHQAHVRVVPISDAERLRFIAYERNKDAERLREATHEAFGILNSPAWDDKHARTKARSKLRAALNPERS